MLISNGARFGRLSAESGDSVVMTNTLMTSHFDKPQHEIRRIGSEYETCETKALLFPLEHVPLKDKLRDNYFLESLCVRINVLTSLKLNR